MRKLCWFLLVLFMLASPGLASISTQPIEVIPAQIYSKTIKIQPDYAVTVKQSLDSALLDANSPEELYRQSCQGIGTYELLDNKLNAGQSLFWYFDESPASGIAFRYRGLLRYNTSKIPNHATILSAKMKIYRCVEFRDFTDPFRVSLNRCTFGRRITSSNCIRNFKLALTSVTDSIDLGLSSDIEQYWYTEVILPVEWINKRGFTDFSILSEDESQNILCLGEQRIEALMWWSDFPGSPFKNYPPELEIEYLDLHRGNLKLKSGNN